MVQSYQLLAPNIKRSLEKLKELGEAEWPAFASWTDVQPTGRRHTVNVIRWLKKAGYVETDWKPWNGNEPAPGLPKYRLSKLGVRALISGRNERE
jgi:hypothetical protein